MRVMAHHRKGIENRHKTMQDQLNAWDKIVEKFNKSDPFFKKVIDSQKAWAKRHGSYALRNSPNYAGAYEHYFGKL